MPLPFPLFHGSDSDFFLQKSSLHSTKEENQERRNISQKFLECFQKNQRHLGAGWKCNFSGPITIPDPIDYETLRTGTSNLCFNNPSKQLGYTLKFESHWSKGWKLSHEINGRHPVTFHVQKWRNKEMAPKERRMPGIHWWYKSLT